jgi:membrane protein DedA with SNARE-associated domain
MYLGRKHNQVVLSKRPAWKAKAEKVNKMTNHFQTPLILSFRFLYGLRTVTPFVIGMSPVSVKKFVLLNGIGALAWSAAVASGGYLFGQTLEIIIGRFKSYELYVMGSVAVIGLSIWMLHFYHLRRHKS